jgi:hypothetical protein
MGFLEAEIMGFWEFFSNFVLNKIISYVLLKILSEYAICNLNHIFLELIIGCVIEILAVYFVRFWKFEKSIFTLKISLANFYDVRAYITEELITID